jgi:hypothetical protein
MKDISFSEGAFVSYEGENWRIAGRYGIDALILEQPSSKDRKVVRIRDVRPVIESPKEEVRTQMPLFRPELTEGTLSRLNVSVLCLAAPGQDWRCSNVRVSLGCRLRPRID